MPDTDTAKPPVLSLLGNLGTASHVGEGTALSVITPSPQTLNYSAVL